MDESIEMQEWFKRIIGKYLIVEYGAKSEVEGELLGVENDQWLKIKTIGLVWYIDLMAINAFTVVER